MALQETFLLLVSMAEAVIILGARWAGLSFAHKLLKYTLPKAKDGLKVFLVMPNTQFCWNLATVRGVIPGAIPDSQLFLPIEPGFAQYSVSNFEFVLGKASRLDPDRKTIEVASTTEPAACFPTTTSSSPRAPRSAAACPANSLAHQKNARRSALSSGAD